jgi:hypothetical protein
MAAPVGFSDSLPILDFDTVGGHDAHPAIGLYYANVGGHVLVTPTTPLPVVTAASSASKGTTIVSGVNTAIGLGATVALPAPPVGTLAIIVQNVTLGGASRVAIRQVGGAAGTGIRLATQEALIFDQSIAAIEGEHIAGPAATVTILFEVV